MIRAFQLVCLLVFCSSPVHAYILEAPHILHLTMKKLGAPDAMSVVQTLTIHDPNFAEQPKSLAEILHYDIPDQYRSDIVTDELTKIYVFSHYNSLTIVNGKITSTADDLFEYSKDPLLLRDRELMENRLGYFGINIAAVSLGRMNDRHYYIIGAMYPDETKPQFWIEKESFLPKRLMLLDQSDPDREKIVEFRYLGWTETGRTWYPMRIETYVDEVLLRTVEVQSIELESDADDSLFDIENLKNNYPQLTVDPYDVDQTDELNDVQQSIEDIKNRFE